MSPASCIASVLGLALLCGVASAADDCTCQQGGDGAPSATLVNAVVTLCTTNADKDRDTRLEIWIDKAGEKEVAYRDLGRSAKLMTSSSRSFRIAKAGSSMLRSEIPGSSLQLRIAPLGHDSWRFAAKTVLKFSDGTTYQKCFPENVLNRDARMGTYHLD